MAEEISLKIRELWQAVSVSFGDSKERSAPYVRDGCYKRLGSSTGILNKLLIYGRDNTLSWESYHSWLKRFVCRCAEKARSEGYKVFGVQFWGECWATKKSKEEIGPEVGSVISDCKTQSADNVFPYKSCSKTDSVCSGRGWSTFIYTHADEPSAKPGEISFSRSSFSFSEGVGYAKIELQRLYGSDGKVEVKWKTEDQSAANGMDYIGGQGVITFGDKETVKTLEILIIDDGDFDGREKGNETFMVTLSGPTAGAILGSLKSGIVTIVNNDVLRTCKDAFNKGNKESGIYKITPDDGASFQVYCDMNTDNGGWTVFQRRVNGTVNFIRGWEEYKAGFGDLGGNFWLGLEKIHRLTKAVQGAVLRVDLRHWNGAYGYAKYTTFKVNDESDKYRLTVENYSGNASDSLSIHNGMYFSTIDRDNDAYSNFACAASRFRGGWWYNKCMLSDLNGEYPTETEGSAPAKFMTWFKFITLWDFGNVIFSEMKMK